MDWNWFFSSLAQSAAAIVGILSAFIITKVISNESEYKKNHAMLQTIRLDCDHCIERIEARYIHWYNKQIRDRELEDLDDRLFEINSPDPNHYLKKLNFSPYDDFSSIREHISQRIATLGIPIKKEKRSSRAIDERETWTPPIIPMRPDPIVEQYKLSRIESLHDERENIDQVTIEIKKQARTVEHFLNQIEKNPEFSKLINISILSILALFFIGVILPLAYLPQKIDSLPFFNLYLKSFFSLKGVILIIISLIFTGIMIVFLKINSSLKYSTSSINDL